MISKSKRMRYRWIVITGNSKELYKQVKKLEFLKVYYNEKTIQGVVYREKVNYILRDLYSLIHIMRYNLIDIKIRIRNSYEKPNV